MQTTFTPIPGEPSSRTRLAFLWTCVLKTPFWAIFGMLPFILYKDLHASALQITMLITLKPVVSIFSMYWSFFTHRRRDRLRSNVMWANVLGYLPFLATPWMNDAWTLIAASGIFMLFYRGVNPAWMEILKLNLPSESRHRIFAYGSTFSHLGGGIFPFLIGWALDDYYQVWRWLLPATALVAMMSIFFQSRIVVLEEGKDEQPQEPLTAAMLWEQLMLPWKHAWELILRRKDFARFQLGFLFGGAGLMVMQPALPMYFVDILGLNYTEMSVARTFCMGIGFAAASPLWARWISRVDIYHFCGVVTVIAAMFPVALVAAQWNLVWLFVAYLIYGMMQAGSEMGWNMSGPIFAPHEDSSLYSGVNVVMVGARGCVAPPLGSLLCQVTGPGLVLALGGLSCLLGGVALAYGRKEVLKAEGVLESGLKI